ncbi:MAG: hypothetical protein V4772_00500 [Pseudomonadota bacterium]
MNDRIFKMALCAAAVSALAACGGGGSGTDDPQPSTSDALVTVTSASVAARNGLYVSSNAGLSDVDKVYDASNTTCAFAFNGLVRAGDSGTPLSGKISYREGATTLSRLEVSVSGEVYAAGAVDDSTVDRNNNQIRFGNKTLSSTGGDTRTLVVSGAVPMRPGRPSGC